MRVILIEDNPQVREYLKSLLDQYPGIQVVGEAEGLEDSFTLLSGTPADLWILDIELRDGNVFALLAQLDPLLLKNVQLVFLTAFGTFDYVVQALRQSAIDYLLKPVDPNQLKATIEKVQTAIPQKNIQSRLDELHSIITSNGMGAKPLEKIPLTLVKGKIQYLSTDKIYYLEGRGNITLVKTTDGKTITTMHNLAHYKETLEQNRTFADVAKQYLVNTRYIEFFTPSDGMIELKDGSTIPATRRGKKRLSEFFKSFFKGD